MKKLFVLLLSVVLLIRCNSNSSSESSPAKNPVSDSSTIASTHDTLLQKGCYTYDGNGSTINFEITGVVGTEITGKLNYSLKEKDSNSGTFKGVLSGDTLFGSYTFFSEGVESTREVAFLVKDKQLIEGVGELNATGTAFKDRNTIKYSSDMPLKKTDCSLSKADCIYKNGRAFSKLNQKCIELSTLETKLLPMQESTKANVDTLYVLFDSTRSKAELILPGKNEGMVLNKTSEGNWRNGDYKLIAWKGYVVQFKNKAVFCGE